MSRIIPKQQSYYRVCKYFSRSIAGKDVTESLVSRAMKMRRRRRWRRDVHDNAVSTFDDPRRILVNDKAVPPSVRLPIGPLTNLLGGPSSEFGRIHERSV